MGIFFICSISCLFKPRKRVFDILRLAKEPFELNDAHFIHPGRIAKGCSALIPLHCFDWIFPSASTLILAHLATYSYPVRSLCMIRFRGGLVKSEGLLRISR